VNEEDVMGNMRAVIPIALSLLIALAGSWSIYTWIQTKQTPAQVVKVEADAVPVVVAVADIPWGTLLTPEMMKTSPYLKESLPIGHFTAPADLKERILIAPLKANDPITEHKLAPTSIKTGGVAAVLEKGKRAVAVKGDKVIGLAGLINPGNKVDVLVTIEDPQKKEERTKTILENVMVLATGTQIQKNEKGEPSPVDVFTLAVTPEEAEILSLGAAQGKLQLALRSVTDTQTVLTTGVNIPKMLTALSPSNPPPPPKVEESKPAEKVVVQKWTPRPATSVEVIKGTKVSQSKF
jgi:pilus assembly protein CpaB